MKKLFTRRKEPKRARAVQLPEGGFDHPFRDSYYYTEWQGREHPRTVSVYSFRSGVSFRHRSAGRSSNCRCVRSPITSEKGLTGGKK